MKELGIQTRASLRRMYYGALVEAGRIKDIVTERKVKKAPQRRPLTVAKRGTIRRSNALLIDQLGFNKADKFTLAKRRESIILRKTE